jgi:hypothetical protein
MTETKNIKMQPDVIAWQKWRQSKEGIECCAGMAQGQYLENRLWRAFLAGRLAGLAKVEPKK